MATADEKFVIDSANLEKLYEWIDTFTLSRKKRNLARDFSDGVLVAEIIHIHLPRAIDLHNYMSASSIGQKKINWKTMNRKVLYKLDIKLTDTAISAISEAKPGAIEQLLWDLRKALKGNDEDENFMAIKGRASSDKMYRKQKRPNESSTSLRLSQKVPARDGVGDVEEGQTDENVRNNNAEIATATEIIYKGCKMVPQEALIQREKTIKDLEDKIGNMQSQIQRLQNLVQLKDQRIDDMAHSLHNIKTMYERVTHTPWNEMHS